VKNIKSILMIFLFFIMISLPAFSGDGGDTFTINFVGDILLDSSYLYDSSYPFKYIDKELKSADITVGNLECPISTGGYPNPGKDPGAVAAGREFIFRGSPEMGKSLVTAGFDLVTLANNHSMDYSDEALLDTLDFLKKNNIKYVGAGKDIYEATGPAYFEVKGVKVAFLGYSEIVPSGYNATEYYPGIAVGRMEYDGATFDGDVKKAAEKADIVIVLFHWGEERNFYADSWQQELAYRAVDMGADLVIGSHPHVLQGIEKYKGSIIAYSLGNFVFGSCGDSAETIILKCSFKGKELSSLECIPVCINSGKPAPATGETKGRIIDMMKELSSELGYKL